MPSECNQQPVPAHPGFGRVFEEGVLLYGRMLWQDASSRRKRAYPAFAVGRTEFYRMLRKHEHDVRTKEAIPVEAIRDLLSEKFLLLSDEGNGIDYTRAVGQNLESVSMFLCSIGAAAGPGDLELFLRQTWDPCSAKEERTYIRSYEGRTQLLRYIYGLLNFAGRELRQLAQSRSTDSLRYWYFDAEGNFMLDDEVLSTNFLSLRSLAEYVEGECGRA